MSFISELNINKPVGEESETKIETPKVNDKKFSDAPIIEDWVSDSEDEQIETTQSAKKEEIPKVVESRNKQARFVKPVLGHAISRKC